MRRKKPRGMSKRKSNWSHVKYRSLERLGFEITTDTERRIVQQIQDGEAQHIEKQSSNRSLWRVQVNDHECDVVYDKKRSQLITILPSGESGIQYEE